MSQTIVVGGGPIGIFTAIALARRGHQVVLVDRDPGPDTGVDGPWRRLGVMQFMHPHFYRPAVHDAFTAEMPDLWDALILAGAEPRQIPEAPIPIFGLACRRWVFERTLRLAARAEPRVAMVKGHAEQIVVENGRVVGLVVDSATIPAELIISVTGRTSPLGHELRGEQDGGLCGYHYVSRMYRALPGKDGCELPVPAYAVGDGYISLILPQDDKTHSALLNRPSSDASLIGVRENAGWDAAVPLIPGLQPWTDPSRFEPITDVLVGGGLTNTYFRQGPEPGVPPARGLFFLGDAVCTTNPAAGRGIALGLMQARQLLSLLDDATIGWDDASRALDSWCDEKVRPYFEDHVYADAQMLLRFAGEDIDIDGRLPSDIICAAAEIDAEMRPAVGMYQGMVAGPGILDTVEERAREVLRGGWRPAYVGPSAIELADVVNRAVAAAAPSPTQPRRVANA